MQIRILIQEGKKGPQNIKSKEFSGFEVLDFLF
jgi:hypothetical protein